MNKTTTRFILSGLLLLSHLLVLAQYPEINQVPSNPVLVCPDGNGQSARIIKIAPNPTGESFVYEYGFDPTWSCCLAQNQLEYTFHVPQTGALIELRRKFFIGGNFVYQTLGQYYSPVTPLIDAPPYPSSCSIASGRIVVTDQSANFPSLPRTFKLYDQNNVLRGNVSANSKSYSFENLPPGTYKVVLETECNNIKAEKTGIVVATISQNPALEIALSGHDDCLANNVNASIVLPESIPTVGVQYRMDGGTWQSSNTFNNVTPWLSHQFSARLIGCFEASTTQFVSELSIPRIQSLERAKDTDCTPANNEIRVFVPEGSDAQIQFNHSGGWYNPGQWIGPLPDGTLHIRARSAYLPSCYRDTLITLSEHGSVSLIGADASNLTDCTLGNIGLQLRTEPAVSSGLEYFVEGKGWQNSPQFSGLSNGHKRIAIRSTGLCQVGLAADTITLSEIIAPQIASIAPQGHDDCVVGNAGFTVYLVQSVSGVKYRINGGAWQAGNLFQNRPAGNYLVEAARADGTCVSSQNYALVETGSVSITGLSKANENDCVVGNAQFQVLHTGGSQQGLKFRLNGGAWQDSAIFRNLTRMAVNVEAQIQKPSCTSSIVAWPDSIREQSNFPEIASVTITGDKNCTVGATVTFSLKVPMTATYWLSSTKNNTTGVFTGLSSGTYTFQVYKTTNGCVQTRVVTIDEKLNFTLDSLRVQGGDDCLNNNAVVTIHHPYGNNYGLQFREVSRNTAWQNSNAFPLNTHGVGQYNLEARNANGCTLWSGSIYGQERLNPEITGVVGIDGMSDCALGNVTAQVQLLNASAGTTKQYRLNGGAWNLSSTLPGFRHGSSNLVELTYNFGGIGTQQCTISKSIVIDEKAKEITGVLLDAATLSDCSLNNVKATIQVDGSTSNLRYVVTGKTEGTSNIFTGLNNGQYKAIIRDVVSTCRDTFNFSVAETPALALPTPAVQNVVCFGAATGSISLSPTGGMAPYSYLWDTGATSASVTGLAAGTYNVTVKDNRGCSISQTVQVSGPAQSNLPQISFTGDTSICKGASFSVSASGGGTYSWNTGATSSTISGSPENTTTYTLTVTNGLGCSASATRIVKVNALPVPNIEGINKICVGQSTTLTATGGNSYAWQHGPTGANITVNPSSTTTYKVTVTNQAHCSAIYNRTVIVNANPVAEILGLPSNPVCGDSTVTLTASGIGSYFWNTGETSTTIQPLITGKRSVVLVVKNANACADTAQAEILFNTRPVAQILGGDIACYGNSTVLTAGLATSYRWNTGATSASISIVAPLQTAIYTVTLSNGLGCSVSAEKVVKVPDALSLSYQLDKDQDCIAKNVSIIPQAAGGQGRKTFTLLRSGELYPYADLNGWGSGEYVLVGKDSMGCVATKIVKIIETPVKINKVNVLGTDDCVPGNTQIVVETEGNRLPLVYGLNGKVVNGPVINLPRMAGQYQIEVSDSLGCVARAEKYYPAYDSLVITSSSISTCDLVDGSIQLSYEGTDVSKLNFSIDGGISWHPASTTFNQLGKGVYLPKVKQLDSGCEINGDSIIISAPDCFPLAAFTKDTLYIRDAQQEVVLPWRIERNGYQDTLDYTLRIGREGDGKPHFTDPNVHTLNENRLRSADPIHFRDYAFDFAGGSDSLALPLQDSAQLYRSPAAYVFQLETTPESPLRVDPLHGRLIVYVNFTDSVIIERKEVVLCPGIQQVTLGEDLGEDYCYAWEGPVSSNLPLLTISPTQNGEYKLNIIRNKDFKIYKTIIYSVKVESKQVQIESSGTIMCEGASKLLGLKFSDGGAIDPLSWVIGWEDGSSAVPRAVQPTQTTIYRVQLKNRVSACVIEDTLRIQVLQKPNYVNILPTDAFLCGNSSTQGLELEVDYPRMDSLNYFWSNGTRNFKTKIFQAGNYYVDVAYKVMPSCYRRIYHQVKEGMQVKIHLDSSGICPDSLPISAQIIRPNANSTYQFAWNTGQSVANVFSDGMHDKYVVTVTEEGTGCEGRDSVNVLAVLERMEERKAEKIQAELLAYGFTDFPCKIIPSGLSPYPELRNNDVVDYTGGMVIELGEQRINLALRLASVLTRMQEDSLFGSGYITRNENFCEAAKRFKLALASFSQNSADHDILLEVWENPDGNGSDKLFILVDPEKLNANQVYSALLLDSIRFKPAIPPSKQFFLTIKDVKDSLFYCGNLKPNLRLDSFLLKVQQLASFRKMAPKCIVNSKDLKEIEAHYIYQTNENPLRTYWSDPFFANRSAWLINNEMLFDTTARRTKIEISDIANRLVEGVNSVILRVIDKATSKISESIVIEILHTPTVTPPPPPTPGVTPLDSFRMEILVNNVLKGRYKSESKIDELYPLQVNDIVTFQLQKQNNQGTWNIHENVIWNEANIRSYTGSTFVDTVQRKDSKTKLIKAYKSGMQSNFIINLVRVDTFPPLRQSHHIIPIIDEKVKKDSALIVSEYTRALMKLQDRRPEYYNFLISGRPSINIYFADSTNMYFNNDNRIKAQTIKGDREISGTYDKLELFNVINPKSKIITPGQTPVQIVFDATVVSGLTAQNRNDINKSVMFYKQIQQLIVEIQQQAPAFVSALEATAKRDHIIPNDSLTLFLTPGQISRYQDAILSIQNQRPSLNELLSGITVVSPVLGRYIETQIRKGEAVPLDSLRKIKYEVTNNLTSNYVIPDMEIDIVFNWTAFHKKGITDKVLLAETLAHELVHARYSFIEPLISLKWDLIRSKQGYYGYDLSDMLDLNGACSRGVGHERYNPENQAACSRKY